ncbi:MAG TPA: hypothetical protein VGL88_01040 [Pseudonocardiaceae bacterium]|jgi:hypothetical protein
MTTTPRAAIDGHVINSHGAALGIGVLTVVDQEGGTWTVTITLGQLPGGVSRWLQREVHP